MDMKKLNPWNWFKHEEGDEKKVGTLPVKQGAHMESRTPFNNMTQLHREIDRLFDDAFRGFPALGRSPMWSQMLDEEFMPTFRASVNIASDDKQYTVTLEAPGMEEKDIDVQLKDHTLYIKGDKQQEQEEKDKHYYRVERHYGTFQRVLAIPDDGDAEEIEATMKNGVLTIKIPRKDVPPNDVKKIEIR